jgi:hypothetical protein
VVTLLYWIQKPRCLKRYAYDDIYRLNPYALVRPNTEGFSWYVLDGKRDGILLRGRTLTLEEAIKNADCELERQGYIILGSKFTVMC